MYYANRMIKPEFDWCTLSYEISDPIKSFYVKNDDENFQDSNYYVMLYISGTLIAFTNSKTLVSIDGIDLYRLDFFEGQTTIPMNAIDERFQSVSLVGIKYDLISGLSTVMNVDHLDNMYYEVDDSIDLTRKQLEILIRYKKSEMADACREMNHSPEINKYGDNVDNVMRIMSGMCCLLFNHGFIYVPTFLSQGVVSRMMDED